MKLPCVALESKRHPPGTAAKLPLPPSSTYSAPIFADSQEFRVRPNKTKTGASAKRDLEGVEVLYYWEMPDRWEMLLPGI